MERDLSSNGLAFKWQLTSAINADNDECWPLHLWLHSICIYGQNRINWWLYYNRLKMGQASQQACPSTLCTSCIVVKHTFDESQFAWRWGEPSQNLNGEPGIANALDVEEGLVWIGLCLVQDPGEGVVRCLHCYILDRRNSHIWMSF